MYDLAVIGLGPGGMEAVNIAVKNGLKVVAFEKENIGGCCLNVGCIPTKTLLHSATKYADSLEFDVLGLKLSTNPEFCWKNILERKDNIVSKFKKAAEGALLKSITLVKKEAELVTVGDIVKISAEGEIFEAKHIIVSSGSIPRELPSLKFNSKDILSSDDLYNLEELPKSLLIVGSGAIGIEWGYILSSFGSDVTIVEKMPSLCPNMDSEVSKRIERILKQKKIGFYKNDFVTSYENQKAVLNSGNAINAEKILVAVGRKPILPKFSDNSELKIVSRYETNYKNLYVIGDATGVGMLAHSASYDARNVMNKILFNKNYKNKLIPAVIYTHPEIASVGIREQDIDDSYTIRKLPIASLAKAWADNSTDGFIKLIIKDNEIKGASVISNEASSLITILNIFIENNTSLEDIEDFIFPHPSYSEIISEVIKRG